MKPSGILIASMLLFTGFCHAQDYGTAHPPPIAAEAVRYGWADVLRVDPVYEGSPDSAPPQDDSDAPPQPPCNNGAPPARADTTQQDGDHRAVGTVIGALIGGIVGHAFGNGNGKTVTTAAGAVAGGVAGNQIAAAQDQAVTHPLQQQDDTERDAVTRSLRDCHDAQGTVRNPTQPERRIIGYDVEYKYKGEIYMARLPFDPGDRMRVKITVVPAE
jgi:uncharacterized protein YcfJ